MFLLLQILGAIILLVTAIAYFGKIRHRSQAFLVGLSAVLCCSSIVAGVIIAAIPMPTEQVHIAATGEKNPSSQGVEVALTSATVDGKEYAIEMLVDGSWFYSKDQMAYIWLEENDERLTESMTQEITVEIPVGAGRALTFLCSEQSGTVVVSYDGESAIYDLYEKDAGVKRIKVPDSNQFFDDFVKLCRLSAYGLMVICLMGMAILLTEKLGKEGIIRLICMVLAVVTTLMFHLNMGMTARSGSNLFAFILDFNKSFNTNNFVLGIILMPMLYKTYMHCTRLYRRKYGTMHSTLCIALPAGVFAAFMVIGNAFVSDGTLRPVFANELQLVKAAILLIGYFALFFFSIVWIFNWLDQLNVCKKPDRKYFKPIQWYLDNLQERPFATTFLTLFIAYIPYIIATYPALPNGDTPHQMALIYDVYELNNAHPIAHTLFLGICVKIGYILFESINIGLFIYSFLQFLFVIIALSFVVKFLVCINVSTRISTILIIYYIVHPKIQNYMFWVTKDIIDATCLLILVVSLYMLFTQRKNSYIYSLLGLADLGTLLFRKDSAYIIILSLIIIFFMMRDFRKQIGLLLAGTLCFAISWNSLLLPALDIPQDKPWTNSNTGILTFIMVQQTARYLRDAGDEITDEEGMVLSAYFDCDKLVNKYTPDDRSDGAVSAIRKSATEDDWKNYKLIWFKMFFKHPEIYIEAILHLKYDHLYPCIGNFQKYSWSISEMSRINNEIPGLPTEVFYPDSLAEFRIGYEALRESFSRIPILNAPFMTSSYLWTLFIWFAYCICRKKRSAAAILMPFLMLVLVLIAGPTNARFFRYLYPYVLGLPITIVLGLREE